MFYNNLSDYLRLLVRYNGKNAQEPCGLLLGRTVDGNNRLRLAWYYHIAINPALLLLLVICPTL
jgi:hypothetical protein